MHKIDENISG